MPFVKLDCGILQSSLWIDQDARIVFLTALLMAEPHEVKTELATYKISSFEDGGFKVPPGWYGFVPAASVGIALRAGLDKERACEALRRLAAADIDSRTPDHDGRRMVRVEGGFIVLNYDKYRERDYTNADRQARYRARHNMKRNAVIKPRNAVIVTPVTQAEAEAEAKKNEGASPPKPKGWHSLDEVRLASVKAGLPETEAQKFFDYFESVGWRVGKARNPMASLGGAIGGWAARWRENRHTDQQIANKPKFIYE